MFRTKLDVDKHVASIFSRKKDEKERNFLGYQIAKLYCDIKEYSLAKKYLAGFLQVRENSPQAHELMGDLNSCLNLKDLATESYKRALDRSGFGDSSKRLVLKICELYVEIGSDPQRMKYWIDRLEQLSPKSEVLFKLKAQLVSASNGEGSIENMEKLVISELNNRPTDMELRLKLLNLYMSSERYEEAYDAALTTDRTTAFVDKLAWFKCLQDVFEKYESHVETMQTVPEFMLHYLHVLRNLTYLSLTSADLASCERAFQKFDNNLTKAFALKNREESFVAFLQEMKGQLFFLAGLLLIKKAQVGGLSWKESSAMSGACFLSCSGIQPIDCQAPWFIMPAQGRTKFYNWWYQQSYFRLSQTGHMIQQLGRNDVINWTNNVMKQIMNAPGQKRIYSILVPHGATSSKSMFYSSSELVQGDMLEPLTPRQLIDIDRVAHQVHLNKLSHLVWLCLQRYSADMKAQPNYLFTLMENIQFSARNFDSGAAESLCQLDVLVFLLATVRCAANSMANMSSTEDTSGRPILLPLCLSKPLCSQDQEEWWNSAYRFCTNSVKEDFSRLRRILIRGIETVRLIGIHGISVPMMVHIAKSLDARANSFRDQEFGCRCSANELTTLENRSEFFWEKARAALQKLAKNQHLPVPRNRLFKESGDSEMSSSVVDQMLLEANFAVAGFAMQRRDYEEALELFATIKSPYATFHRAEIYKDLGMEEEKYDKADSQKQLALLIKSRECLYEVMDHISGNKSHPLHSQVQQEMEYLDTKIHDLESDNKDISNASFHTPSKSPVQSFPITSMSMLSSVSSVYHSTPRHPPQTPLKEADLTNGNENERKFDGEQTLSRPRPSPERLECQIRSLNNSQSTLFKMVLDRNEELILLNGKMIEEQRENNIQLRNVLQDNKTLMEELKQFLTESKDSMKLLKTEMSNMKTLIMSQPSPPAQIPQSSLFMPPLGPRSPYPGFPQQQQQIPMAYRNYFMGAAVGQGVAPTPPQAQQSFKPAGGLPGSRSSHVGKYRTEGDEEEDEDDDDGELVEDVNGYYGDIMDDPSLSVYYSPDSQVLQDWSRNPVDPSPAALGMNQRMNMPQSGYFSQAVKGQPLQFQQNSQPRPPVIGPGFFAAPVASAATTTTPEKLPTSSTQSTSVLKSTTQTVSSGSSALANLLSQGSAKPEPNSTASLGKDVQVMYSIKATYPSQKLEGQLQILVDKQNQKVTVTFITLSKEALFAQNVIGLTFEPTFIASSVAWSAAGKSGAREKQLVVVAPDEVAKLKEALVKASKVTFADSPEKTSSQSKTLGGFTFSSNPVVTKPTTETKPKETPKPSVQEPKPEAPKPFAGFSLTTSNTQGKTAFSFSGTKDQPKPETLPATKSPSPEKAVVKSPGKGESERVDEFEPNVDFKPVIELPELVNKTTGEEDETPLLVERCRMFRFDLDTMQWKERGTGEMKILSSKKELRFRIVMRRDQILKLCANHAITGDLKLTAMQASDRAWCYAVHDFADEEMKMEQLAVKFKNVEKAQAFKQVFEDCVGKMAAGSKQSEKSPKPTVGDTKGVSEPVASTKEAAAPSTSKEAAPTQSLSELFKPKIGTWECGACLLRNEGSTNKCAACETLKPGAQPEAGDSSSSKKGGAFTVDALRATLAKSGSGGFKFGTQSQVDGNTTENNASLTTKPQTDSTDVKPTGFTFGGTNTSASSEKGFTFGSTSSNQTGFTFGKATLTTTSANTPSRTTTGFSFGSSTPTIQSTPSSIVKPTNDASKALSGFAFKPGVSFGSTATTTSTIAPTTSSVSSVFGKASPATVPTTNSVPTVFGGSPANSSQTAFGTPSSKSNSGSQSFVSAGKFNFSTPVAKESAQTPTSTKPDSNNLLAKLLTEDNQPESTASPFNFTPKTDFSFATKTPSKDDIPGVARNASAVSSTTQSSPFNFTMNKTPDTSTGKTAGKPVPSSPEIDDQGRVVTREGDDSHIHFEPVVALPDKIEVKTGEEDEAVLFESRAKIYRFVSSEWKEKGVGVLKILEHKTTKKSRILMRRDQVLKICCNHVIDKDLNLQPMPSSNGKAWIWYAMDFSEEEGQMEQLAVRFRNAEIATEFKDVFDKCRDTVATSPSKNQVSSSNQEEDDDVIFVKEEKIDIGASVVKEEKTNDVIFVKEEKATEEQIARARKYLLPDHFYLYESKPPCPGCIGCTDGEVHEQTTENKGTELASKENNKPTSSLFGSGSANLPNFSSLIPTATKENSNNSGKKEDFVFGAGSGLDFSSLASSNSSTGFAFGKKEDSSPFKFAGAGTKLFGSSPGRDGASGEDDSGVAASQDVHFEPVIPLPDLVEVTTGEEDWSPIFCQRSKVYKFDQDTSQWKERGVGDLKIMKHRNLVKFRILQRRDQVLKVSCNHLISADMELKPMTTSETALCWVANDFSDTEPSVERFAAKFKTKELAEDFKSVFAKCQEELKNPPAEATAQEAPNSQSNESATLATRAEQVEQNDEEEEEDDDDDYEDYDDEDNILYEKRATLSCFKNGAWHKLGMGQLRISYDDDLNGHTVQFVDDEENLLCSHVICREVSVSLDSANKSCEWKPLDFSTDDGERRHFRATLSSKTSADEFAQIFTEGQRLAVDSQISENLPTEIDRPEIFSRGEPNM